jgi:hypothetical protein
MRQPELMLRLLRAMNFGFPLALSSMAFAREVPADIQQQIPSGWDVISRATVSVGPSRSFYLVAMADKAEDKFRSKPYMHRSLWIFERTRANRYQFVARNDDVILRPFDAGIAGNGCDPFEERTIAVTGIYFTVENGIACGAHWTDYVTFRFDTRVNTFVFDNWRVETWSMNRSNDPNAEALVSDGQRVVRAKGRPVRFEKWERPDSPTERSCSMTDIEACSAMWDLVGRKDFKLAMRRFLGPGKATWTMENWDRTDQVLTTLSVSSEDPTPIDDGLIRMGGCFPHNCPERAEVFFGAGGQIKAVALLYHDCIGMTCTGKEDYTLRIFVREESPKLIQYAKDWAEEDMRASHERFPQFEPERLSRTIVDLIAK